MNVLRLFLGDQKVSRANFLIAVATLALFGVAVNGIFELWKLFPTLFLGMQTPVAVDWWSLFIYLFPTVLFMGWMMIGVYPRLQSFIGSRPRNVSSPPMPPSPHRGIILALSKPAKKTPEEILEMIRQANEPDSLYEVWSIGQIFKGIYLHKSSLSHIWPLTTADSRPFGVCIEEFVRKFMPRVVTVHKEEQTCHLDKGDDGSDMIAVAKANLALIYAKENLNTIAMQPADIIVDITGGTKDMSIGMAFGALDSAIDIQYVEQQNKSIIPLSVTPEIVLDKVGEYLEQLYVRLDRRKGA